MMGIRVNMEKTLLTNGISQPHSRLSLSERIKTGMGIGLNGGLPTLSRPNVILTQRRGAYILGKDFEQRQNGGGGVAGGRGGGILEFIGGGGV
ncbi:hypothetical protein TIFTF001_001026 [Ficus carica]|uniref:Uncharacterized protein n=1 Tax=Ficus carica TaxID=3494 RepID=A0AA87YY37_FICCA|nr:hypothetical protein TIFTF001_001026 [Ficus carica]